MKYSIMKMKNIKKSIRISLFFTILIFSCKKEDSSIVYKFEITEEISETTKTLRTKLIKPNSKAIEKEFEIKNNEICEVYRFYDFNNELSEIYKLNLTKLSSLSTINIADSINNNFAGIPQLYEFEIRKYILKNGDLVIQKIGIEENSLFEKYTFSKELILKEIYY
jgi:hypothetical protein